MNYHPSYDAKQPPDPPAEREQPSRAIVDPANAAEMARLMAFDDLIIDHLGLFPPSIDDAQLHNVLDIACGPGAWSMQVAFQYPEVDILSLDRDPTLLRYAQAHARVQGLHNVSFEALEAMESIPSCYDSPLFDLVQARFLSDFPRFRTDFLASDRWASLLASSLRVLQPGGTLHLMETAFLDTNSASLALMYDLLLRAIAKRERVEHVKVIPLLQRWVQSAGYEQIKERVYLIHCSAGERAYAGFFRQIKVAFKLLQPFLVQTEVITQQQADQLYQHVLIEMLSENFCAAWFIVGITVKKRRQLIEQAK
jgi:ubiquinone/menaquinone biosynthesis C-methylase UbiE